MSNEFSESTKAQKFAICELGTSSDDRVKRVYDAGQLTDLKPSKDVVIAFLLRACGP